MLLDAKTYFIIWPRFKYVIHLYDALVNLLSWSRGITGYFWTISPLNITVSSSGSLRSTASSPSWKQVAEQEHQRLMDQQTGLLAIHESNTKDDTTPWLNRTGWPQLFVAKDLKVLNFTYLIGLTEVNRLHSIACLPCINLDNTLY